MLFSSFAPVVFLQLLLLIIVRLLFLVIAYVLFLVIVHVFFLVIIHVLLLRRNVLLSFPAWSLEQLLPLLFLCRDQLAT